MGKRWQYSRLSPRPYVLQDKGRFKEYVYDIPVYLIVHDNPGLL
ncbi:glucokinase, partial [Escherichia coli]